MDIEGKPFSKWSHTVARLLVILTRFLFNLPALPEEPDTCLTKDTKNDGANKGYSRLKVYRGVINIIEKGVEPG